MSRKLREFVGTPSALDEFVANLRKHGKYAKVKRIADLDTGERRYQIKLVPGCLVVSKYTEASALS